ncbi:hypothetical protein PUNSTDRAFT_115079 [Punctularia strigosozonata HHB-11173 SS5]|uniref:uncharacterized protein n=1 Tax=Punctularia strigosozonata (strain HHB-11173) TaxID=741275 RepID=UPI00044163A6|nr:uncharacterized protein PUNSTDRAFT_115079 [Punctularia strigosozonata HHB-11173 SS5]EIN06527.1 hypothetical protein PUNSTDRAFT_115079 [Punctularia strigosozonata HHB-11173 SS5]
MRTLCPLALLTAATAFLCLRWRSEGHLAARHNIANMKADYRACLSVETFHAMVLPTRPNPKARALV